MDATRDRRKEPLTRAGKRYIARDHISAIVQIGLAFGAAGTLAWLNAWLYGALVLVIKAASALVLVRTNPAVLNARGEKRPMSVSERVFFSIFVPAGISLTVVSGLDVGQAGWTHHSLLQLVLGLALTAGGAFVIAWALAVNPHFEPTVRIQRDRAHSVCTTGPYRWVRHPGYSGAIVAAAGLPLIFGSWWCFVPVVVLAAAFVTRTASEDQLLRAELDGYAAYAAKTRYRLCPLVW